MRANTRMSLIDLILNFAGLLLWLKWRDNGQELSALKVSLLTTLKKSRPRYRGVFFLALLALLLLRAPLYWQLGSSLKWTPQIWFGVIPLSFRSDFFWRIFLFSLLSFGATLVIFYLCLLLLSILNGKNSEFDALKIFVRAQLGKLAALPAVIKLFLPWFTMIVLWCSLNKLLVAQGILPASKSFVHIVEQGAILGLGIYLVWKYLIVGILLLHVLNSYIYLGNWPFWILINNSARQILKPISWLPLRFGKMDFAPVIAIAVVIFISEYGSRELIQIYQRLPF